jgi:hypothetical protein
MGTAWRNSSTSHLLTTARDLPAQAKSLTPKVTQQLSAQARSNTRLKSTVRLSSIETTGPKRGASIW